MRFNEGSADFDGSANYGRGRIRHRHSLRLVAEIREAGRIRERRPIICVGIVESAHVVIRHGSDSAVYVSNGAVGIGDLEGMIVKTGKIRGEWVTYDVLHHWEYVSHLQAYVCTKPFLEPRSDTACSGCGIRVDDGELYRSQLPLDGHLLRASLDHIVRMRQTKKGKS